MKSVQGAYLKFVLWIQLDLKKDRVMVNRKVFSVVLWCLLLPAILSMVIYGLRKYAIVDQVRYADGIIFLPPFFYALYALWPTLRDLPRVFHKGGIGALLDESAREVEWREKTAQQLQSDLKFTDKEWSLICFHLQQDIERMREQNKYLTVLTGVVLFFMFQFLDLGGNADVIREAGPAGLVKAWVDQFTQWGVQLLSLFLFSSLFYLSGLQFQRYLMRYWVCLKRMTFKDDESA